MSESVKQGLITLTAGIIFCLAVALLLAQITMVRQIAEAFGEDAKVIKEVETDEL